MVSGISIVEPTIVVSFIPTKSSSVFANFSPKINLVKVRFKVLSDKAAAPLGMHAACIQLTCRLRTNMCILHTGVLQPSGALA